MKPRQFIELLREVARVIWEYRGKIVRAVIWRWFGPFAKWWMERHKLGQFEGIAIVSFCPHRIEWKDFVPRTIEALKLVKQLDPLRFGRLQRYLDYIQCRELGPRSWASYEDRLGICHVDFHKFEFGRYPTTMPYIYAAILVHEATHGAVANGEMRVTDLRYEGIEYACDSEAAEFLKRFHPKVAEIWMRKYTRLGGRQQ